MANNIRSVDRGTLQSSRGINVVGWSAVAFGVALGIHIVFVRILDRAGYLVSKLNLRPTRQMFVSGQNLAARFGARAGCFLIAGLVVGWIVGSRVWKRQALVAAGAALGYVLTVVVVLEYNIRFAPVQGGFFGSIDRGLGWPDVWAALYDVTGLVAIAAAALLAGRIARSRMEG